MAWKTKTGKTEVNCEKQNLLHLGPFVKMCSFGSDSKSLCFTRQFPCSFIFLSYGPQGT